MKGVMTSDDEQAFTAFVTNASPRLLVFAQLLMGDRGEAEDALQVALMRLTRHWPRELAAPTAYVRRALVNIARDRARRRHLVPMLTSSGRPVEQRSRIRIPRSSCASQSKNSWKVCLRGSVLRWCCGWSRAARRRRPRPSCDARREP